AHPSQASRKELSSDRLHTGTIRWKNPATPNGQLNRPTGDPFPGANRSQGPEGLRDRRALSERPSPSANPVGGGETSYMAIWSRVRRFVLGAPKDVKDPHAFHKLSLIALLAWVGLGADGLSSSAYGPEEAFRALGEHTGLAIFLALATAMTVIIISYGYSR